ncbi:MAG: sugar transferase [Patescibacteria group bacterium]|jgi:exopolysaccharide biosynthesis polyprenyl glycosylphosphotransferase
MTNSLTTSGKKYLLLIGDIFILYFSLWITLLIRYQNEYNNSLWNQHLLPFTIVFGFWLIVFFIDDLYELNYIQGKAGILSRLLRSIAIGLVFAIIFFYLGQNRIFTIRPQTVLLINAAIAGVLIYLWHLFFGAITKLSRIANGLMIVGFNNLTEEIIDRIVNKPQLGFQLKIIIAEPQTLIPDKFKNIAHFNHFDDLKNVCLDNKINTIVSTVHPRENPVLAKSLFACLPLKVSFFDVASFYEKIIGKIPVTTIEQIWFLENLAESDKKLYEVFKRAFDIIFSLVLFLISLPFIPFIALAIKLDSKGPVFFKQQRSGKEGKPFMAVKFRTMFQDAEANGPQWAAKNDSRVTRLGKIMRKTRIDEIPQLLNVLRGEMSLIGPRPERPEFVEQLQTQIPFYKERLLVKPGLTGWAQVFGPAYGGSKEGSLEKLQYDLFYIKNRSLALDLSILLKTIRTVLSSKGQ